jgi:uncharacterized protein with LGFP repeats
METVAVDFTAVGAIAAAVSAGVALGLAVAPFARARLPHVGAVAQEAIEGLRVQRKWLGAPLGRAARCGDRVGWCRRFQRGAIYWHPKIGASVVRGAIGEKWAELGSERGLLGYPVSDEDITEDGEGRYSDFQGGSIYSHPETGAWEVHGAIRDKWAELGWEGGFLGYPVSGEEVSPTGQGHVSRFQGGSIYCGYDTGIRVRRSRS